MKIPLLSLFVVNDTKPDEQPSVTMIEISDDDLVRKLREHEDAVVVFDSEVFSKMTPAKISSIPMGMIDIVRAVRDSFDNSIPAVPEPVFDIPAIDLSKVWAPDPNGSPHPDKMNRKQRRQHARRNRK